MSKISLHNPVHQLQIGSPVSLMAELTSSFSTALLDFCSQASESDSTDKPGSSDQDSDIDWDNYDEGAEEDWADIDGPDSSAGQNSWPAESYLKLASLSRSELEALLDQEIASFLGKCQPLFLSLVNFSRQGGPNAK